MPKLLQPDAIARYREDGILFPIDVLGESQAADLLARYRAIETAHDGKFPGRLNQKPHLLFEWLDQLVRHPGILDAVQDVLGPDLFCWGSQFFAKQGNDPSFVSWHQDATYWGLSAPDVMTAWVALTPSQPFNGCMRVIPGTQRRQMPHADTFADANLLSRGQEVAVQVDQATAIDVTLNPGQMSLHHVLIVHGSEPNESDQPRIGFAIRYVPTSIRQLSGARDSAMLVRGTDRFGHFEHEQAPEADLHPAALARHKEIIDRQLAILYTGASKPGKLGNTLDQKTQP